MYLYLSILKEKEAGFEQAAEQAVQETALAETLHVSRYHGSRLYYVVEGQTAAGAAGFAFVPAGEGEVSYFRKDGLYPAAVLLQEWRNSCPGCELQDSNYAIDRETPLLEIKYINEQDRYVFAYYSLLTGKKYESIPFIRS